MEVLTGGAVCGIENETHQIEPMMMANLPQLPASQS